MLRIDIEGPWCYVDGPAGELDMLHDALSITIDRVIMGRFRRAKRYLYNFRTGRFPVGVLYMARRAAKRHKVRLKIKDPGKKTAEKTKKLPKCCDHLYDYQKEAVEKAISRRYGILDMATASGKTQCAVGIACRVPGPTLFLVDEKALLRQAGRRYEEITGKKAGSIGDGTVSFKRFTVATFQTLHRRIKEKNKRILKYLDSVVCVIADEAHTTASRTFFNTLMKVRKAVWRIGLTATPTGRSDKLDTYVCAATGPVIYRKTIAELSHGKKARIAVPRIVFYRYPGQEDLGDVGLWPDVYREGIVECEARNRAIIRICQITPKPVIVFFERINHGYELLSLLEAKGICSTIVHGKTSTNAREECIEETNCGEVDVLLSSRVFTKGTDIPELRSCVNASGYKAEIQSIQKLGRGLRKGEDNKEFVFYWDLMDDHHDTLYKHACDRFATYYDQDLLVREFSTLREAMKWFTRKRKRLIISTPE